MTGPDRPLRALARPQLPVRPLAACRGALWKRLGIDLRGVELIVDDQAPQTSPRRALTAQ